MLHNVSGKDTEIVAIIREFLGHNSFTINPLPADASLRRYYRVNTEHHSFILMDSPKEYYNLQDFIKIADLLRKNDFLSPQIYYRDLHKGYLILEDFGKISVKDYLLENFNNIQRKENIYKNMIDILIKLTKVKIDIELPSHTIPQMIEGVLLYIEWYLTKFSNLNITQTQTAKFIEIWQELLNAKLSHQGIVLRDYHVENILYLANGNLGLLDFQDASIGSPIYDLVSLLQDARIAVNEDFAKQCFTYYLDNTTNDTIDAELLYHLLGLQRNMRILGVFARKALRDGDKKYLAYLPRVNNYINLNLSHNYLYPIKAWIESIR